MKYYIIKDQEKQKIIKVNQEQEENFLEDYKGKILCSGKSLTEAFQNFEKLPREEGE
jgi:hypothetical protein